MKKEMKFIRQKVNIPKQRFLIEWLDSTRLTHANYYSNIYLFVLNFLFRNLKVVNEQSMSALNIDIWGTLVDWHFEILK